MIVVFRYPFHLQLRSIWVARKWMDGPLFEQQPFRPQLSTHFNKTSFFVQINSIFKDWQNCELLTSFWKNKSFQFSLQTPKHILKYLTRINSKTYKSMTRHESLRGFGQKSFWPLVLSHIQAVSCFPTKELCTKEKKKNFQALKKELLFH